MWFIPYRLIYNIDKLAQKGFDDTNKQDQQYLDHLFKNLPIGSVSQNILQNQMVFC